MATTHLIDHKAHNALLSFLDEYHVLEHQPRLALMVRSINTEQPTALDVHLWHALREEVGRFQAFHDRYPFAVAKPGALSGRPYDLGLRQKADGQAITLDDDELQRSGILPGPTGEGKTTLLHHVVMGARRGGAHVVIIDPKGDAQHLAACDEDFLILTPEIALNILDRDESLSFNEHVTLLVDVGASTLYGGEDYKQVMSKVYHRVLTNPRATMHDVIGAIRALPSKGETYKYRDAQRGAEERHQRLITRYPGLHTAGAPGLDALFNHSIYVPLTHMTETEDFLVTYLIRCLFHHHEQHRGTGLRHLVTVDEGVLSFRNRADTISGRASLSSVQGMGREMGISFYVSTNALRLTDESLRSNVYLTAAFRPANGENAEHLKRALSLSDDQTEYVSAMPRGEVVLKIGRIAHPVLAVFDPLPKITDDQAYLRAQERTRDFLARTAAAREGMTGQRPALPAPPRLLPAAGQPELPLNTTRIALNTNEEKLLHFIGEHKVVLTTECDLHPQLLIRAKKKLLTLALITEAKITARAGRGGQANALALTAEGCQWLRLTPGGAGGGGLQHQYLVRKLIETIPGAQREVSLAGKRVDILFTYTDRHVWLATLDPTIALNTGDHVAIEVEVSDPAKTALSNAEKNAAAGVRLTLIAVLPGARERTSDALAQLAPEHHVIVVNVFDLLKEHA
jgi:RecA/RadA recombinase